MGEVVNLRLARKRKARDEREKNAERNRVEHGVSRRQRDAAAAEKQRAERTHELHRRDPQDDPSR